MFKFGFQQKDEDLNDFGGSDENGSINHFNYNSFTVYTHWTIFNFIQTMLSEVTRILNVHRVTISRKFLPNRAKSTGLS